MSQPEWRYLERTARQLTDRHCAQLVCPELRMPRWCCPVPCQLQLTYTAVKQWVEDKACCTSLMVTAALPRLLRVRLPLRAFEDVDDVDEAGTS